MLLDISKLMKTEGLSKQPVEVDLTDISYQGSKYPVIEKEPFEIDLFNDDSKLFISGECNVTVLIPCDRCLEDTKYTFSVTFSREIQITDDSICVDEESSSFIVDESVDVDRLILDEILLNWPSKVLCNVDCKGLCSVCGQNLNIRECGCDRQVLDPRMAAFQDVFKEFKEV